jgi:hypothetical protein
MTNYHNCRAKILRFFLFKLGWCRTPLRFLFVTFDRIGIEFYHRGDDIIWLWPWRCRHDPRRFISLGFSGTGEFGDAKFYSIYEIDCLWEKFYEYERT